MVSGEESVHLNLSSQDLMSHKETMSLLRLLILLMLSCSEQFDDV